MKIQYPMCKDYITHWGIWEAVRELLQNAIDMGDYQYNYDGKYLVIENEGILDRNMLLMGKSVKGEDSIGKFGEGLKLAMLVLCRLNKEIVIQTGKEKWEPILEYSRDFDEEVLIINITESISDKVTISLLLEEYEWTEIRTKWIDSPIGKVNTNENGQIYVGGLFVCKMDNLKYSYNFSPRDVELNRDRDIPSIFDIQRAASKILQSKEQLHLAMETKADVSEYNIDHKGVAEAWVEEFGEDTVPIGIGEQDNIKTNKFKIVPDWLAKSIRAVKNFIMEHTKSPIERLDNWFNDNKYFIINDIKRNELETIIKDLKQKQEKL